MFGAAAAYFVGIFAMLFCGLSAVVLIRAINRADPPEASSSPEHEQVGDKIAV
jgi:hypothetical protein